MYSSLVMFPCNQQIVTELFALSAGVGVYGLDGAGGPRGPEAAARGVPGGPHPQLSRPRDLLLPQGPHDRELGGRVVDPCDELVLVPRPSLSWYRSSDLGSPERDRGTPGPRRRDATGLLSYLGSCLRHCARIFRIERSCWSAWKLLDLFGLLRSGTRHHPARISGDQGPTSRRNPQAAQWRRAPHPIHVIAIYLFFSKVCEALSTKHKLLYCENKWIQGKKYYRLRFN